MGALCDARDGADLLDEGRDCGVIEGRLADGEALRQACDEEGIEVYSVAMNAYLHLPLCLLLFQMASPVKVSQGFHWDWRDWQELIAAQSLRNAKMSEPDRAAIAKAIEAQIRPDMSDLEIESEKQLAEAVLDTRVKMIDLNHDGTPEVVAQGMAGCSPTGNCSFWVFQKTTHGYKLLLNGFGQTFTVQKASTNGFRDIVVAMQDSASDSGLTLFRYKGMYHQVACYDANWAPLENGVIHQLKEPRVTADSCDGN